MTHSYRITGMTCANCEAKIKTLLGAVPGITSIETNVANASATISMLSHVTTETLQAALQNTKYIINDAAPNTHAPLYAIEDTETKTWLQTYKPLLLVFAFITGIAITTAFSSGEFHTMRFMNNFMAGFFLTFSFFKLLDVQGFADSYSSYDLLAKKWRSYGIIYPFIELALGIAYLLAWQPQIINIITIAVMGFSSIGVIQSVMQKRKIKCACLGAVFNLPMSTVTIVEDVLMVAMALIMLVSN